MFKFEMAGQEVARLPLSYVMEQRAEARRRAREWHESGPAQSEVDLAKRPGLVERFLEILNPGNC